MALDMAQIEGLKAAATLISGPAAGWVVAYFMGKKMDEKDGQLLTKHDAHIKTLELQGERCDANYKSLMDRVFRLEDKKADKE